MDSRHWQHENHQVARDVETSIGLPGFADIDTMTRNWFLIRLWNWGALKNGRIENRYEPVGDDERKYQIATDSQPFLYEDSQVQKQNRYFSDIQSDFVEWLSVPVVLGPVSSSNRMSFSQNVSCTLKAVTRFCFGTMSISCIPYPCWMASHWSAN